MEGGVMLVPLHAARVLCWSDESLVSAMEKNVFVKVYTKLCTDRINNCIYKKRSGSFLINV